MKATENGKKEIRCAIYTRKSTDEGLDQDFNTLDAQREAGEAYIASQRGEGWVCGETRYDDGGFTGGNMERPALKQLLVDIEDGLVDCVVVYKVDRLSRSLLDFASMMRVFETHNVAFVSVTQQFNTADSMGRLMLNVLLSFAQFERELISERTRDKIAAARRKGLWSGGKPVLGYDIEHRPGGNRLAINRAEAKQVRRIFDIYLETESLTSTLDRLDELGWTTKKWTTKAGRAIGGTPFVRSQLFCLLTNVVYLGKVKHNENVYEGQHDAIIDEQTFKRVGATLKANRAGTGRGRSNKHGALLRGVVRCKACGCAMTHACTKERTKSGAERVYRYYVCVRAQKRGWRNCPGPSLPATELERFVVDQIRALGRDDMLLRESITEAQERLRKRAKELEARRAGLLRKANERRTDVRKLLDSGDLSDKAAARIGELREEIRVLATRVQRIEARATSIRQRVLDEDELAGALEAFDPLWESLTLAERERLVRMLIREVLYDAENETISVTFHATADEAFERKPCRASR